MAEEEILDKRFKSEVIRMLLLLIEKVDAHDKRFDTIDKKFDAQDEKIDTLSAQITEIGLKVISIDKG